MSVGQGRRSVAENLAGMLKVQGLTSSTRGKKKKKGGGVKAKEIVVVYPHSLEDILSHSRLPRDHV